MAHENEPNSASPQKSGNPANSTFRLALFSFGGMLLLGAVLWFLLVPGTPLPPVVKLEDPVLAATNSTPPVPETPPYRASKSSQNGSLAASQPSPLDKKPEVKPEKPPEKKDPDEEAVTLRFPNPLPAAAPILAEKNFATATGAKGKLPPPEISTPLQKRIPKKLSRPDIVAPLAANGSSGGALTLGLKGLTRDEALIETGLVDALEAVYGEGDSIVTGSIDVVKRTVYRPPPVPMPRPKPEPEKPATPKNATTPGTNDPPKDPAKATPSAPTVKAPPLVPPWVKTSPKTNGISLIRYRLLQVDEEGKAQMILGKWLSRYAFATSRIERIKRTDDREIQLIIFDPSSATMGFTVMFWTNGNVVNQIATYGKIGAKDLFLMLPY